MTAGPDDDSASQAAVGRLRLLGALAAALRHDVGQPLNGIRLSAEAAIDRIARGNRDPGRLVRSLEAIAGQVERLQETIDHLVAVAGKPDRPMVAFSAVEAVRGALAAALPRLAGENVRLRWHADLSLPPVLGHPHRLRQAVANLLDNGCDAIANAALSRGLDGGRAGTIEVACRRRGDQVAIAVEDDGCGLPPEVLAGLAPHAGPFPAGQRIGLTVAVGVAAEMGGELTAVNRRRGTRVEMRLPIQPATEPVPQGMTESSRHSSS